ncbi:MAG: ABC transporter permease [Saprospiraceae bacterium]|nr:ABC transporter permease [Saprospiraceae bacterium]
MNFQRFLALRVAKSGKQSFTRLIIVIATAAVALSLTVMLVTTSMMSGFKKEITGKVFGFWGHIHITDAKVNRSLFETQPIDKDQPFLKELEHTASVSYDGPMEILGVTIPNTDVEKSTLGGFSHVQSFAILPGIIQTKKQIEGILLKGVGEDFNWDFLKKNLKEGEIFQPGEKTEERPILISRQTADRLEIGVGDRFIIHFIIDGEAVPRRFTISGIYKTGLEEYDKQFALVDIADIQQILGWTENQVAGFEVEVDYREDLNVLADYLYFNILPNTLYAETIREKFPAIFEWLALQDLNEVVILVLMLIVAIINMITALLILILERTNMIGILKSLGETNWGIRKVFLYYAGYIMAMGLFWGNLIGLGICFLQKTFGFIKLSEADYYLNVAPIHFDWGTILLLNLGTMFITLLFLIIPTYLVTRISPVKAIRFK